MPPRRPSLRSSWRTSLPLLGAWALVATGCTTTQVPDPKDAAMAYADAAERGDAAALEAIGARHPEMSAEVKERLAALARGGRLVLPADDIGHSWQTFMVVLADGVARDAVIRQLAAQGIEANLGAQCVSAQPAFAAFAPRGGSAEALRLFRQGLALPFCERYGAAEVEQVARSLTRVLEAV